MEKIVFTDGTKICLLDETGRHERESGFIAKYKENARRIAANNAWKKSGTNAVLRGEYDFSDPYEGENAPAYLNGVTFTDRENVVAYSFTVGQSSGIYYKDFSREKGDEAHVVHDSDREYLALSFDKKSGTMLVSTQKNGDACRQIAQFIRDGDRQGLTDGDSRDDNPAFSPSDGQILFDSAGVGRDARGEFAGYAPSALYALDPLTLDMVCLKEDEKYSYCKPKRDRGGDLYAIRRPAKEKRAGNPLLEILLIPVRIVEAIVGFVQFFVVAFAGKSLVAGKEGGSNPAKGREKKEREIFVEGNRIRVDRELRRNKRFKEKDYGFIPRSWQLVRIGRDGAETVLKSGVCDYALGKEGVYCTDGRHIYFLNEKESRKIADADFCLHLNVDA